MEIEFKPQVSVNCYCNEIPQFAHDLAQSLLIIHAYVIGCSERIKENHLDSEQLKKALNLINDQIKVMGDKIYSLS